MTVVGYARVSTLEQDPALQDDALIAAGAEKVFTDFASGATTQRPHLTACLNYLRTGDTLAVRRIDRHGRSMEDLTRIVNDLADRGIQFQSTTKAIDTTTVGGELVPLSSPPSPRWNARSSASALQPVWPPYASAGGRAAGPP